MIWLCIYLQRTNFTVPIDTIAAVSLYSVICWNMIILTIGLYIVVCEGRYCGKLVGDSEFVSS